MCMTTCQSKPFVWSDICQANWEEIMHRYIDAPIWISPNWKVEFHVHTDAFHLTIKTILAQNQTSKFEPIVYASRLLNHVEHDYTTIKHEALAMVYALYKFLHYY